MTIPMPLTTAQKIGCEFYDDGECWRNSNGEHLDEVARYSHGTRVILGDSIYSDDDAATYRWNFEDGSAIVCAGACWDFPLSPEESECYCFKGLDEHQAGCPLAKPQTWTVERRVLTSLNPYPAREPEILAFGGEHQALRSALIEADARNLLISEADWPTRWTVSPSPSEEDLAAEEIERDDVFYFLVDTLGIDTALAARLAK